MKFVNPQCLISRKKKCASLSLLDRNSFIRDISELSIRYTSEIMEEKEVLTPQDFLDHT